MKVGNEALKEVNKLLSIEDIETILDETKEASEKQEVSKKILTFIHIVFSFHIVLKRIILDTRGIKKNFNFYSY